MDFLIFAGGLIYALCMVLAYRQGMRDAQGEKTPEKAILPPKKMKSKPTTEEEKKAADRQRRIDEFRG